MGDRPLVSIIIPHLNQIDAAERCLRSLEAQNWPADRMEIILVDNGSTGDLAPLKVGRPALTILHEPRPGPGLARNTGVAAARGEILAFIDADCRAHPGWVAAAVRGVEETGGPVGGDVRIDFVDESDPTPLEAYEAVFAYRQKMYIERQGFSGTGNLAMPVDIYRAVGPFAGIEVAEDRDWGQRARAAGIALRYRSDMIAYHPARQTMDQLRAKWRRHIAHDLERGTSAAGLAARAAAVAASTVPHGFKLLASPRVIRPMHRLRGLTILARIRLWRSMEMIRQRRRGGSAAMSWNRGDLPTA